MTCLWTQTTAASTDTVVEDVVAAASDLSEYLANTTMLPVSVDKSAVLSNHPHVARSIHRALRIPGTPPQSVRSLGVDLCAGRKVRSKLLKTRANRYHDMHKRVRRNFVLATGSKSAPGRVWATGVLPSILYDAPVHGLFGRPLRKVRQATANAHNVSGPKRSLDIALAFLPDVDPEVTTAVALWKRFSMEVWDSSLPSDIRSSLSIPLGELAYGLQAYIDANPTPPKAIRGPISAMHTAMDKYGWEFNAPFTITTRNNTNVNIVNTCPRRTCDLFRRDCQDTIFARGFNRVAIRSDGPDAQDSFNFGMFFRPLLQLYRRLPPTAAARLLAWVSGGIFTRIDLVKMGYDVDPVCPRCLAAPDTLYHRCFTCVHVESSAVEVLGNRLFQKILAQGKDSLMANRGMVPFPYLEDVPATTTSVSFIGFDPSDPSQGFTPELGDVFLDGSCLSPSVLELSRAGWGACQIDSQGQIVKAAYGLVPHPWPQTSLAGEVCSLVAALQLSHGCRAVSDCAEVVRSWQIGFPNASKMFGPHACTFKSLLRQSSQYQ